MIWHRYQLCCCGCLVYSIYTTNCAYVITCSLLLEVFYDELSQKLDTDAMGKIGCSDAADNFDWIERQM